MNGRMYDPVIGRFMSTDPLTQLPNYNQSYKRYSYTLNNPLKFSDPSGFAFVQNMDWFINELTGDVYYNRDLKKGDEKRMRAGWVHFAENDKFSLKGESDYQALTGNSYLTEFRYLNAITGSAEFFFKGKNAETLLNGQGYIKKYKVYEYHEDIFTYYYPAAMMTPVVQTYDRSSSEPFSYQYVSKDKHLIKTLINTESIENDVRPRRHSSWDPSWHTRYQSWSIREDIYGDRPNSQYNKEIMELLEEVSNILQPCYEELWRKILK